MGTKDNLILETHFDWINTWFLDEFLFKYMLRFMGPLRIFLYNYVLYSFGLILNYISRFHEGGDRRVESDSDSENDGFGEELTNFLFQSYEDVLEDSREKSEGGTCYCVLMELHSDIHEDEGKGGETKSLFSTEVHSDVHEDGEETEGETESSVFMEIQKDEEKEGEIERFVSMETHSDSRENEEKEADTKSCISMEVQVQPNFPEDGKESERETEGSVLMEAHSDSHEDGKKSEEETEFSVLMDVLQSDDHEDEQKREEDGSVSNSAITTRKYQYVSGRNISGFMEEPTAMSFTFREFYVGPNVPVVSDNNAFSSSEIIAQKQEHPVEKEEKEKSVQENEFLGCNNSREGFKSETLEAAREERPEESGKSEEKHGKEGSNSNLEEEAYRKKAEEWKKVLAELEFDEENEGEFEWEHDDIVEQLKMELRHARQGGLPTIPEEEEEEEEEDDDDDDEAETESPNEVKDQKLPKTEENNPEFQDQMDEIEEVYMIYEEKMRKLDILNYQTMHALGLLQLKDPLKSSFPGMKPLISHNIWPRKEAKSPLVKLVEELQRDLEMVYVGQVCLSWEILCWQHKKALQLKHLHYHSHSQYNEAADEFQLFQVLMQRFIENESFQGPRTHNFVKNRCVIPNLLQVPPIRDDSVKVKNMVKGDEEYAVCSERLAEIIKESMWLFWKFVRADKDDGNLILRVSHQTRTHLKDPVLSDLAKDIRFHLHKKEKKLKDLVRSGNCIVRKFQKHQQQHEDQLNHEQLLAQVELKLVSRVLSLSKLRKDHLLWCNEKLNRIKFVKKKVVVEPSLLLFPC